MEAGITVPKKRQSTRSSPQDDARMGKGMRRFLNRGLWLHARVIPAAFASGKTGHISGAMDVNLEWTRISDDRRPRCGSRDRRPLNPATNPVNLTILQGRHR